MSSVTVLPVTSTDHSLRLDGGWTREEDVTGEPLMRQGGEREVEDEYCGDDCPENNDEYGGDEPHLSLQEKEKSVEDEEDEKHRAAFLAECRRLGIDAERNDVDEKVVREAERQSLSHRRRWWFGFQNRDEGNDPCDDDDDVKKKGDKTTTTTTRQKTPSPAAPSSVATPPPPPPRQCEALLRLAKAEVLMSLQNARGDSTNPRFLAALKALSSVYLGAARAKAAAASSSSVSGNDPVGTMMEGTWQTLTRPHFKQCLGQNRKGEFVYTLGRMSFDMFRPTALRCAIRKIICRTRPIDCGAEGGEWPDAVPRSLREEVLGLQHGATGEGEEEGGKKKRHSILRTYDIEIHFSIEPKSDGNGGDSSEGNSQQQEETYRAPTKPLKAIMTNRGYALPDPDDPLRFTVWWTDGVVAPVQERGGDRGASKRSSSRTSAARVPSMPPMADGEKFPIKSAPSRMAQSGLGAIGESVASADVVCTLSLQECRLKNKHCDLHGVHKMERERRHKLKKSVTRYVRPRYGPGCQSGLLTTLKLGDLDAPYSAEWEDIFAPEDNWKRSLGEQAKALAVRLFMGAEVPDRMEDDGTMAFKLNRPIGGHGMTFVDVLYVDEDMRITRGNAGSIFVQIKDNPAMQGQLCSGKGVPKTLNTHSRRETRPTPLRAVRRTKSGKAMAA